MADNEYWKTPLDEIDEKDLDISMIEEINSDFSEEDSDTNLEPRKYSLTFRLVGLITLIVFFFFGAGYWMKQHNLPPFNLIAQSQRFGNDQKIQELQKAVVEVNALQGQGTGFNIQANGLIITNNHVIENGAAVYVKFKDGSIFQADKVTAFPEIDIAVLDIKGDDLPVVQLATKELKAKEEVIIIGNPLGVTRIVDRGIVVGPLKLKDWEHSVLAIQGRIHKGNSGSPVFNIEGKVTAVVFATLALDKKTSQEEIIGLAIPLDLILKTIEAKELLAN